MRNNGKLLLDKARAIDTGREPESVGADSGSKRSRSWRESVGPAALVAAGLAWLIVNRERARERSLPERLQAHAHQLEEKAGELRAHAAERMADLRSSATSRLEDARSRGAEQLEVARERYSDTLDSAPLMLGLGAFAAGLGLGLLVPSTRPENRYLAAPRQAVLDRAREVARRARVLAGKSLESASEAALETLEESL